MRAYPYWIKERHNPQLGTYYVAMGQMSKTAAKKHENAIHGDNVMHRFDTEAEYLKRGEELMKAGERLQQ